MHMHMHMRMHMHMNMCMSQEVAGCPQEPGQQQASSLLVECLGVEMA